MRRSSPQLLVCLVLALQLAQGVAWAQSVPTPDQTGQGKPLAGPQTPIVEPSPGGSGGTLGNASVPAEIDGPRALHVAAEAAILQQSQKPAPAAPAPPSQLPASGTLHSPGTVGGGQGHIVASLAAAPSGATPTVSEMLAHGYLGVPLGPAQPATLVPVPQVSSILGSRQVNNNLNCGFGANEASVAQANDNPNWVVVAAQMYLQANGTCTGDSRPWAFYSHDGGQHWLQTVVSTNFAGGGDTTVVYDPKNHRFIEAFIEFTRDGAGNAICPNRVGARASSDGGASWGLDTTFQSCPANGGFDDKDMITVDQNPTSPHYGRVTVVWSQFGGGNCAPNPFCLWNAYTDNGGNNWTFGATSINQPGISTCGNGNSPAYDANGELLVVWFNCTGGNSIRSELSTDGGATWPDIDRIVTNIGDIGGSGPGGNCLMNFGGTAFRCNSFPALAGDPNPNDVGGRAFQVIWADADAVNPGGGQTIAQIKGLGTENAGGTWNGGGAGCPPSCFSFNYMSNANRGDKFFPWISFSPSGRLNVGYSSREDNATVTNPHGTSFNEHGTEASSFFALRRQTAYGTYTIDGTLASPGGGQFIGDYAGITSQDNNFDTFPDWTDVRNRIDVRTADLCFIDCYTFLTPYSPLAIGHGGGTTFTDLFQFNTDTSFGGSGNDFWNAVGIREGNGSGVDDDTILFDDRYYNVVDASSSFSPPFNDYTVENDNFGHSPSKPYFPQVHSFSTLGGSYSIEWAAGHIVLSTATDDTVASSSVTRVYDAFLSTGTTYFLGLRPSSGNTANMSLTLHSASRGNQQGRANAVADGGNAPPGQPDFISYATGADSSQFDGVVVLNNNGGAGAYTIYLDTQAPTGTIDINSGAAFTNNRNVTLNLTASNPTAGDPVSDMAFSNDGVNFTAFQPFAASAAYMLPAGDGNKTVFVRFRNGAGVISTGSISHTIFLDTVAPTVTALITPSPNGNGWNNTSTTVSWTCSDPAPSSGIASCSSPTTLTSEGANQPVTGTGIDNAGNTTSTTVHVSVDETPPSSQAALSPIPDPDGTTHANTTVTISATDALSGVTSIHYQATGAQPIGPTTVPGSTTSFVISANGETDIRFHATDRADNNEGDNTIAVIITRSQASFDRTNVPFGNVEVGTISPAQTVTLTDTGNLDLNITSITPDNSDYTESDNCGGTVAAGTSCQIMLTLSPTSTGADNGNLVVIDSAADSPQTITLTGTGTAPAVSLTQTTVDFGTVPAGTTSGPQTVTLTNSGTAALNISSIGTNNPDFNESDNCPISPSTLAPTGQCTLTLTVTPASGAGEGGNVIITDDASGSPQSIAMTVNGGAAPPQPAQTVTTPTRRAPAAPTVRTPTQLTPTPRPTPPRR